MRNRVRIPLAVLSIAAMAACGEGGTEPFQDLTARQSRGEGFVVRSTPRVGYVTGQDGKPMKIVYEVHHGRAIWEGDIDLGPAEGIATAPERVRADGPRLGVVRDGSKARWPGGVVPYVIDANLPQPSRVSSAISHIQNNTGRPTFVPRTTQRDYVRFVRSNGCASSVGKVGGAQLIYLADGCSTGNTIHEISHALGMYHEQSRCDRDSYVRILTENIIRGYENNFAVQCGGASDVLGYDEGSIMHYDPFAFSANGLPTIVSLRGLDRLMGQRSGLSNTDVGTINSMYP